MYSCGHISVPHDEPIHVRGFFIMFYWNMVMKMLECKNENLKIYVRGLDVLAWLRNLYFGYTTSSIHQYTNFIQNTKFCSNCVLFTGICLKYPPPRLILTPRLTEPFVCVFVCVCVCGGGVHVLPRPRGWLPPPVNLKVEHPDTSNCYYQIT